MDKALMTMIANMPDKTGRSLEEWKAILSNKNFEKHGKAVAYLKSEYEVTHGFANTIVTLYRQSGQKEEDLVAAQYQGKEHLKPIHDRLVDCIADLGEDVQITPKKSSVSCIRKYQFALIKPATKKRVDLGLKIKGRSPEGRLLDSGPFGTMCTHRIQLTSVDDIDSDVLGWIREAYDASV